MALPVIAAGLLARLLLRGGIAVARKYAAKNGVRITANVLSKAKNINKTKKVVNPRLKTKKLKAKKKVEFKPTSAKQKNIKAKTDKKYDLKTKKKTATEKKPPTDTSRIKTKKKVDKKVDKKSVATKSKDTKVKTSKKVDKKVDKKSLATKKKTTTKTKTDKKADKKVDKKSLATKKKAPNIPLIVGATVGGGLIGAGVFNRRKAKPTDTDKIKVQIKPKPDAPRTKPGPQSGPKEKKKLKLKPKTERSIGPAGASIVSEDGKRMVTYQSRVRDLVAQKDRLKNIDAKDGSGRNEYQVRINKLKKENPKAFKKMFTLGGFGKLKD